MSRDFNDNSKWCPEEGSNFQGITHDHPTHANIKSDEVSVEALIPDRNKWPVRAAERAWSVIMVPVWPFRLVLANVRSE